ncbi:hypothetical protein [Mixta calida]|uniref:hypothetical protein n=1 Tax=Mixta calida TaxID=665913 RepID=UPI00119D4566|nr:hypothetical protein [Mixta calida]DAV72802.1 MAG TPA: hypothetical protein [Caudoviricetes sp.]
MSGLSNKEMIERLARFRDAGDKLYDDVFNITVKISDIIQELDSNPERNEAENSVLSNLKSMSEMLIQAALDANEYNASMLKDYTKVIKALGDSKGVKPNV